MTEAGPAKTEQSAIQRLAGMEEELAAIRLELDHHDRLATIGTVAAGVAHEINNLLTPAMAYSQLARSRPDDAEIQRKMQEKASTVLESASRILRAIQDFAAPVSVRETADVDAALTAALDCLGRDLSRERIDLVRRIPQGTLVAVGELALQQAFVNLLLNAARAMGGRGGRIEVVAEPGTDCTMITVADDGPGIPPEIAATIFEPFVSSAPAANEDGDERGGSGLGLTMCRRAIQSAGGDIDVESTPGAGAIFRIQLPPAA